jgi:hypothetical protein
MYKQSYPSSFLFELKKYHVYLLGDLDMSHPLSRLILMILAAEARHHGR